MTVPHDEPPLTRRALREREHQKPRKQRKQEAQAAKNAHSRQPVVAETVAQPPVSLPVVEQPVVAVEQSQPPIAAVPAEPVVPVASAPPAGEPQQTAQPKKGKTAPLLSHKARKTLVGPAPTELAAPAGAALSVAAEEAELLEVDDTSAHTDLGAVTIDKTPSAPLLAPIFQEPVQPSNATSPTAGSFDDIVGSPSVGASNSIASTNALVVPTVPNHGDVGTALDETGEVIITGSIDLPMSLGATGAHPADALESAELDALLEHGETVGTPASEVAPVSASRAVSAHGSNAPLINSPKRAKANAPVVLAVVAAVLAIGVTALLLSVFVFRVF